MIYQALVSFEYWTLIAQLLNFFIQLYLFKRFLFKPIQNIIKKRQAEADNLMKDAQSAKDEAVKSKEEYEASLKNARLEASKIAEQAVASANKRSEEIIENAQKEAKKTLEKAEKTIELDRQKVMSDARKEISGMAVDIASKLVKKEISEKDNQALIDSFIDEYGKMQ